MTSPITLRQLEALLLTAEAGSIRRASSRHGRSQPGLSTQIMALEKALDQRLFERRANGVTLTAEGREIAQLARQALDIVAAIAAHAPKGARRGAYRLKLGVGHSIGPYLMPYAVRTLHSNEPDLRLLIREGPSDWLLDSLLTGETDLILTQLPIPESTIRHVSVFEEDVLVMMAADHPLTRLTAVTPADLAGQNVLSLGRGFTLTREIERFCATCGAVMVPGYEGTSLDALRIMCSMGSDIAFAPEFYLRSELKPDAAVVARPLAGRELRRMIVLAWRESQGRPRHVDILARDLATSVHAVRATSTAPFS